MTIEEYKEFEKEIKAKGYNLHNYPGTIHNESYYFSKGFAYEDKNGESMPRYQVIFLVWDRKGFSGVPEKYEMGVSPLVLTQCEKWERVDLEITDSRKFDVEFVEKFAEDFHKFLCQELKN